MVKILIVYTPYLYLLHNLISSPYKKVTKMSKDKIFHPTYLVFYIKQGVKILKNSKFYLPI